MEPYEPGLEDDYFKCVMCEMSHHIENSITCDNCDEKFCKGCYEIHSCVVENE